MHKIPDVLAVLGVLFIGYGCWQFSESLAWIVIGVFLLATGVGAVRAVRRDTGE